MTSTILPGKMKRSLDNIIIFIQYPTKKPRKKNTIGGSSRMHALDVHAEKLTLDDHNSSFIVI